MYGEEGANQLAREWVRKSNHYMVAWLESGGLQTFRDLDSIKYEASLEFVDWAATVDDLEGATFARIHELHEQKPVFQLWFISATCRACSADSRDDELLDV